MSATVTYDEITTAYNVLIPATDQKSEVFGQPAGKDFYEARKIIWLFIQTQARAGSPDFQEIVSSMPMQAITSSNPATFDLYYNSEKFTFALNNVFLMTPNEADFFILKSTEATTPLEKTTLANFFALGKPEFFYW